MRSGYAPKSEIECILGAMLEENRLACETSLATGLRISDVLSLKTDDISRGCRFSVKEQKTGKVKRVYIPQELQRRLLAIAGHLYVFEGRSDGRKHRTRQAVYKDLKRVARAFRLDANITPHSMRKIYAVEEYRRTGGDLAKVKKLLNHTDEAVTLLYVMSSELHGKVAKNGRKG